MVLCGLLAVIAIVVIGKVKGTVFVVLGAVVLPGPINFVPAVVQVHRMSSKSATLHRL